MTFYIRVTETKRFENKTKKMGRPRILTSSAKKKAAQAKRRRTESIRIGEETDRWAQIKSETGSKTDIEVAKLLIDR